MNHEILISPANSIRHHSNHERKPLQLVFDDESMQSILYLEKSRGPTLAGIYTNGLEFNQILVSVHRKGNIEETIKEAGKWAKSKTPLSIGCCAKLLVIMNKLVPNYPCPKIAFDLKLLEPLIREVWKISVRVKNERMQVGIGTLLYRYFEHYGRYDEARRVLSRLIEIFQLRRNTVNEAVFLNNFAFEYLLEEKWEKAIPLFEKAALMFKDEGKDFDYANARINYWICLFSSGDYRNIDQAKKELAATTKILVTTGQWHSRKPFILDAMIAEKDGNIPKAIKLVKKAIKASAGGNTRYSEIDSAYLMQLKKKTPSV